MIQPIIFFYLPFKDTSLIDFKSKSSKLYLLPSF